jgi:hypothetical protein
MTAPNGYFIRVWKNGVDDGHPLYAGWIHARAASEAMRMAVDSWTHHPVDFAVITINRADRAASIVEDELRHTTPGEKRPPAPSVRLESSQGSRKRQA